MARWAAPGRGTRNAFLSLGRGVYLESSGRIRSSRLPRSRGPFGIAELGSRGSRRSPRGERTGCHRFGGEGLRDSVARVQPDARAVQHDGREGLYYDPTLVRHTEPYMNDNDDKNTGGKPDNSYFETNPRVYSATKA